MPGRRRGWDSNPRYPKKGTTVFETAPIDRSGTSPRRAAGYRSPLNRPQRLAQNRSFFARRSAKVATSGARRNGLAASSSDKTDGRVG